MDIDLNNLGDSSRLNISFKDDSFSTTKDISIGGGGWVGAAGSG